MSTNMPKLGLIARLRQKQNIIEEKMFKNEYYNGTKAKT